MTLNQQPNVLPLQSSESAAGDQVKPVPLWKRMRGGSNPAQAPVSSGSSIEEDDVNKIKPEKWSMGILSDRRTDEVPGTHGARYCPVVLRVA